MYIQQIYAHHVGTAETVSTKLYLHVTETYSEAFAKLNFNIIIVSMETRFYKLKFALKASEKGSNDYNNFYDMNTVIKALGIIRPMFS